MRKNRCQVPIFLLLAGLSSATLAAEIKVGDSAVLNVGLRLPGWGQWTENGAADG